MRRAFSKPVSGNALPQLMNGFREAGYEGLQLKTGQFMPWIDDPKGFVEDWREPGVASSLVYYDELDDDRLASVVDFAHAVGSELVIFCHNHAREGVTGDERVAIARQLARHAERARSLGLGFSLHHHYGHPVMLPEDVREFWGAIEPGLIGLTVDTAHLALSGIADIPSFLAEFAPIVDNIHLKDFSNGEWRLVGQGDLDLDAVLRQLVVNGYDGWLCIDEESPASLTEGFAVSRRWLDEHLSPAGA